MIVVNGVVCSEVSAADRGLAYGDGVFRTFPARWGTPLHWSRQYAKLAHDCEALRLGVPDAQALADDIQTACGETADAAVKIIITRGVGERGYRSTGNEQPTRIVQAQRRAETAATATAQGVKVRLCSTRLSHQPALAGIKHLNRLENVLARAEWDDLQTAEGLMCDAGDNVISGTMTNVFIVKDGVLATPRLDLCGVAGVTRERVLEAARRLDVASTVMTCTLKDVLGADEVFLVNSLAGLWAVRELDSRPLKVGRITQVLQQALEEEDNAPAT